MAGLASTTDAPWGGNSFTPSHG